MDTRSPEHTAAIDSLYRISSLVSNTEDPRDALEFILREIVAVLQPTSASISLVNPDSQRLEIEVEYNLPAELRDLGLALGEGITGWSALHGRSLVVADVLAEPRYVPVRADIRSEMAVPMEDRGVVIGVVNVDSERVGAFDDESLKILTLLTGEATRVVTQLWLVRQLRSKNRQLETLVNMGRRLVTQFELDEILAAVTRDARRLMNCHICALFLLDPESGRLRLRSMVGQNGEIPHTEELAPENSSVGAAVVRRKQVEVSNLPFTEEHHFVNVIQREHLASMLSSPIIFDNEVIGVINAYTNRPHRFNNDEKNIFAALAGLGGIAIQNARLYARVFESEESLRSSERLTTLGLLAAEIAHEIRNPLTVIKLLFDSLDLEFDDERGTDVKVIREKLDQLEEIVNRVLSFGRSKESMHARYPLNTIVEDTLRLMRLKLLQQKIEVRFDPVEGGPMVYVNKGQVQQVILNLLINAMQAMADGGRISIATREHDGHAELLISDTGNGIPENIRGRIFDSFLSQRPGGSGLGLSISKRILRSHSGDIELVESGPQGSRFRVVLPLREA